MKPFGMSGAYRIYVPTPKVCRSTIGALVLGPVRYASVPVTLGKMLVMKASAL